MQGVPSTVIIIKSPWNDAKTKKLFLGKEAKLLNYDLISGFSEIYIEGLYLTFHNSELQLKQTKKHEN